LRAETSARPAYEGGASNRYTSHDQLQRAVAVVREADFGTSKHALD